MRAALPSLALLLIVILAASGCGGMVRAVKVVPDTAEQLCQQTRAPDQMKDC